MAEQLDAAEMAGVGEEHLCQCLKCGRYHRSDTDVVTPA